jgi:phosphoglycolate phosphatase-like HAD superfamily hydrolase
LTVAILDIDGTLVDTSYHQVVLASSAKAAEVDRYLDLLSARELADAWTPSADVEATKPAPDLVRAALKRTAGSSDDAVMVGDTPWDVHAARNAGVETIAVLTGGFAVQELLDAGAVEVFDSVDELRSNVDLLLPRSR